jgi:hypothetical protein
VQHGIHKLAGSITGEGTPGAVRAVGSGSKSHDQYARVGIAETSYGLAPVFPAQIGTTLDSCDFLAIRDQARTPRTGHNFLVENHQPIHPLITSHPFAKGWMARARAGLNVTVALMSKAAS